MISSHLPRIISFTELLQEASNIITINSTELAQILIGPYSSAIFHHHHASKVRAPPPDQLPTSVHTLLPVIITAPQTHTVPHILTPSPGTYTSTLRTQGQCYLHTVRNHNTPQLPRPPSPTPTISPTYSYYASNHTFLSQH